MNRTRFAFAEMPNRSAPAAPSKRMTSMPVPPSKVSLPWPGSQMKVSLPAPVSMLAPRDRVPWTRAVIDEALRLFPPAWAISRRSTAPDTLGGTEVPEGTLAIISPWVVHRRADLWPDPLAFRPERFLDPGAHRSAYLPFGLGPRLCIGREFAIGEMAVVLDRLLATHRVAVPDGWRRPRPQAQVAVHPEGGMPLRLTRLRTDRRG